jgi:plasmid stabilization system protein ParE
MTMQIRPARPGDRDAVVDLLHQRMNPRIARERWSRLFDYAWRPADAPDCGRILERDGTLTGFLGATYVDRPIGGRLTRICNMSSWYLMAEVRGQGYGRAMVVDLTADPAVIYTDLTATAPVHALLLAYAGFAVLDDRRWLVRRRGNEIPAVIVEGMALEHRLDPRQRTLLRHHAGFRDCRAVWASVGREGCFLILQVKTKGEDISYHQLLHASAPAMLVRCAQAIAEALLPAEPAVLAIDGRLVPARPEGAESEPILQPRLFKSRLPAADIDNLYNEVLLLDQKLP